MPTRGNGAEPSIRRYLCEYLRIGRTPTEVGSVPAFIPGRCQSLIACLYFNTDFCIDLKAMKTTLDINDELLIKAKALSARERKSLTSLIEEGLRLRLRRAPPKVTAAKALPIYHGKGGLLKGIDARSNRALLDAADDA